MNGKQDVKRPEINGIYRHFKGNLYKVITLAKDSETGEDMVVYQALYGDYTVYVRSLAAFAEALDRTRYPQATQKYRFEPMNQLVNLDWQERDIIPGEDIVQEERKVSGKDTGSLTEVQEQTPRLDPLLEAFLEADTYRERLNTLRGLEHRITDEMINTMAVVMDLEIPEGPLEKRYRDLENSILTLERFECTRLV